MMKKAVRIALCFGLESLTFYHQFGVWDFWGVWGMGSRAWNIKKAQRIAGAIAAPGGRIGVKSPIARRFYFLWSVRIERQRKAQTEVCVSG